LFKNNDYETITRMMILSVGMPRAGSGWYYNLTNELGLACGWQDARQVRQRYHLEKILTEVNCNIGALTPRRLLRTLWPSLLGNTFVVKAHAPPTPLALRLIRYGFVRATYIYRDPRDAMLSASENGQRALDKGRTNAFSPLVDFDAGLAFIQEYVHVAQAWLSSPGILSARYEDLLENYDAETLLLTRFLDLPGQDPRLQPVLAKYRPEMAQGQKGSHFRTGKIGRFRLKYSPEQQAILNDRLGAFLEQAGYPAD
jgi:hypothetical protein